MTQGTFCKAEMCNELIFRLIRKEKNMKSIQKKRKSLIKKLTRSDSYYSQPITVEEFEGMLNKLQNTSSTSSSFDDKESVANDSITSTNSLNSNNARLKMAHKILVERLNQEDMYLPLNDPRRIPQILDGAPRLGDDLYGTQVRYRDARITWSNEDEVYGQDEETMKGKTKKKRSPIWFIPGPFFCCLNFHLLNL